MRVLTTKFEDSIHVAIARKGKGLYTIIVNGPEELLDHGFYCRFSDTPPPILKRMPQILSRVKRGENVPLSRSELHRSGIAEMIANDHYRSIIF